jgi:hypothetical protein
MVKTLCPLVGLLFVYIIIIIIRSSSSSSSIVKY